MHELGRTEKLREHAGGDHRYWVLITNARTHALTHIHTHLIVEDRCVLVIIEDQRRSPGSRKFPCAEREGRVVDPFSKMPPSERRFLFLCAGSGLKRSQTRAAVSPSRGSDSAQQKKGVPSVDRLLMDGVSGRSDAVISSVITLRGAVVRGASSLPMWNHTGVKLSHLSHSSLGEVPKSGGFPARNSCTSPQCYRSMRPGGWGEGGKAGRGGKVSDP